MLHSELAKLALHLPESSKEGTEVETILKDNLAIQEYIDISGLAIPSKLLQDMITKIESKVKRSSRQQSVCRTGQQRLLWIDAICINQNDLNERKDQVQLMGRIFLNASFLIVWLGPENLETEIVFQTLSLFTLVKGPKRQNFEFDDFLAETQLPPEMVERVRYAALNLFQRPWFSRVWINQEYIFGALNIGPLSRRIPERILFTCGKSRHQDSLDTLIDIVGKWFMDDKNEGNVPSESGFAMNIVSHLSFSRRRMQHAAFEMTPNSDSRLWALFVERTYTYQNLEATDPRDRIYSGLGQVLASSRYRDQGFDLDGIIIDYNAPVQMVYSSFVRKVIMETKRLDILGFCMGKRSHLVQASWCPDWSISSRNDVPAGLLVDKIIFYDTGNLRYAENSGIDASARAACEAMFADDLSTVTVSGFIYDKIATEPMYIFKQGGGWRNSLQENCIAIIESLGRVVAQDFDSEGHNSVIRTLLFKCLTPRKPELTMDWKTLAQFQVWAGGSSDTVVAPSSQSIITRPNTDTEMKIASDFSLNGMVEVAHGNTVAGTDRCNIVRPCYDHTMPGDLICILLGCAAPIILRPNELRDRFEVLGDIYVPGVMNGEALQDGLKELQKFILY